jgi:hypothetical protein
MQQERINLELKRIFYELNKFWDLLKFIFWFNYENPY